MVCTDGFQLQICDEAMDDLSSRGSKLALFLKINNCLSLVRLRILSLDVRTLLEFVFIKKLLGIQFG